MKEREFQKWILDVAAANGWRAWHVPTPMRPISQGRFVPDSRGAGLPDLILIRGERLIFAEVKKVGGKLSDGQREFLRLARGLPGVEVYEWRPGVEDLIERTLAR